MKRKYRVTTRGWIVFSLTALLILYAIVQGVQFLSSPPQNQEGLGEQVNPGQSVEGSPNTITENTNVAQEPEVEVQEEITPEEDTKGTTSEVISPEDQAGSSGQPENLEKNIEIDLSEDMITIYFEPDSYRILDAFVADLRQFAETAKSHSDQLIVIEGNQNSIGDDVEKDKIYGDDLSQIRAKKIEQFLLDAGIEKGQLTIVSNGNTKPIHNSLNPEDVRLNRRVDVYFLHFPPKESDMPNNK